MAKTSKPMKPKVPAKPPASPPVDVITEGRKPKKGKRATPAEPTGKWAYRVVGHGFEAPDQLLAHPHNLRIHPANQQAAIKASLDELGWVDEVIVNRRTGYVLNGHERVRIAMREEEPAVPVKYVDLDEEEELKMLLWFDRLTTMAIADGEKVLALMAEVTITSEELRQVVEGMRPMETTPPTEFPPYDGSLKTDYRCPKCGYEWSGKQK